MGAPVLNLSTLVERPRIMINDQLYELASPDELSVVDHQRLHSKGRHIERLMAKDSLDPIEETELTVQVKEASDIVLRYVPEEVRRGLADTQRIQVLDCFSMLSLRRRLNSVAAAGQESREIGEKSPPGSNGSLAETQAGG